MPVRGSVAPIVTCVAVTPGTFLVAAPAPTIELPAVTRPRHSKSAVPVIVTRRVLDLTIYVSPLMLNCCCVSVGVIRGRCKSPRTARAYAMPQHSHRARDTKGREEHREDQESTKDDAVELAREVALRVE